MSLEREIIEGKLDIIDRNARACVFRKWLKMVLIPLSEFEGRFEAYDRSLTKLRIVSHCTNVNLGISMALFQDPSAQV